MPPVDPNPWLQYGALGLLGLVLVGLAAFLGILAKSMNENFRQLLAAIHDLAKALSDVRVGLTENTTLVRSKLDSIERDTSKDTDPPAPETPPRLGGYRFGAGKVRRASR